MSRLKWESHQLLAGAPHLPACRLQQQLCKLKSPGRRMGKDWQREWCLHLSPGVQPTDALHKFHLQEIDLLVWAQKRCRKAFGSSIADNMMCVSKKKKPIDATCNVGQLLNSLFPPSHGLKFQISFQVFISAKLTITLK